MKKFVISLGLALGMITGAMVLPSNSYAVDCSKNPTAAECPCAINPSSSICSDLKKENGTDTFNTTIKNIINILLSTIGIVSVIIIITAGIRMVTSRGDSGVVAKAIKTISHAVVGLFVAMISFVIVNFVAGKI